MSVGARPDSGLLFRLHPVTRLAMILPVLAMLPFAGVLPLAVVALAFLVWGMAAGIGGPMARRMALVLLPVALALAAVHGFLLPRGTGIATGFREVFLYPEGLAHGGLILARLAALLAAGLLVVTATPPGALADGLEDKGLPPAAAYLLTAPLGLAQSLALEAGVIRDALQVRGMPLAGSPLARLRVVGAITLALVRVQLLEAAPRALALEARGFRALPRRSLLEPPADSVVQARARWGFVALSVLILVAGVAGWA